MSKVLWQKAGKYLSGLLALLFFAAALHYGKSPLFFPTVRADTATGASQDLYAAPANPDVTTEAENVYYYLQGLGDKPTFVVGAFDSIINAGFPNGNNYDLIHTVFGVQPGLYSARYYWTGNGFALNQADSLNGSPAAAAVNHSLYNHYDDGAVLLVHADSGEVQYIGDMLVQKGLIAPPVRPGDYDDAILYLDPEGSLYDSEAGAAFWGFVAQWADAFEDLEDRGVGAYMFRPFVEMNSKTFFGKSPAGRQAFKNVWRQLYDYFYTVRGLDGCLLTFAPADYSFHSIGAEGFYPGNDYTDVLAPTFYLDDTGYHKPYDSNYSWMTQTGKPLGFSECSVRTGDWQGAGNAPPGDWGVALEMLLETYTEITWVNTWAGSSYSLFPPDGTGAGNYNGDLLLNSEFSAKVEDLPNFKTATPSMPGLAQFYPQTAYHGAPAGIANTGEYSAAQLSAMGISIENIASLSLGKRCGITFYSGPGCTGTEWAYLEDIPDAAPEPFSGAQSVRVILKEAAQNLIASNLPSHYYVSGFGAVLDASKLYEQSAAGQFNESNLAVPATSERLLQMTDGDLPEFNLFYRAADQQAGKCLVFIYDLGSLHELDSIAFFGIYGSYRIGSVRFYASASRNALFESASRADTLEDAELDTCGVFAQNLRYVKARYAALVITKDVIQSQIDLGRQYNMARAEEFQVFGRSVNETCNITVSAVGEDGLPVSGACSVSVPPAVAVGADTQMVVSPAGDYEIVKVKANGELLLPESGGSYSIKEISQDQHVVVTVRINANLIRSMIPHAYYVSAPGAVTDSSKLYVQASAGQFNESNLAVPATSERLLTLTDGDLAIKNLFYRGTDQQAGKCLVLIYDLGGSRALNQINFIGESGSYRVGAIRFYAGDELTTLFNTSSRVDTFGNNEIGATGTADQQLASTAARYVAFVITKDVIQSQIDLGRQYNMARVKEFEVYGYR